MSAENPSRPPHPTESKPERFAERPHDKLVVLATFENSQQAHCLRAELEQNGITAAIANESSAQLVGASHLGRISAIWIEVLVLESDAERALAIKQKMQFENAETNIPEWTCSCGETVDEGFAQCWSCMSPFAGPGSLTE